MELHPVQLHQDPYLMGSETLFKVWHVGTLTTQGDEHIAKMVVLNGSGQFLLARFFGFGFVFHPGQQLTAESARALKSRPGFNTAYCIA